MSDSIAARRKLLSSKSTTPDSVPAPEMDVDGWRRPLLPSWAKRADALQLFLAGPHLYGLLGSGERIPHEHIASMAMMGNEVRVYYSAPGSEGADSLLATVSYWDVGVVWNVHTPHFALEVSKSSALMLLLGILASEALQQEAAHGDAG